MPPMRTTSLIAAALAASAGAHAHDAIAGAPGETITPAFAHALPNVPGKAASAVVVFTADAGDKNLVVFDRPGALPKK